LRILAVDYGDARTGLAISDTEGFLASPVGTLSEWKFETVVEKITAKAIELKATQIVIGYPKNMNGSLGERAEKSERLAEALKESTKLKVVLWDERCTTISAHNYLNATDTRGKKRKAVVDTVAATIILQDYLDFIKNKKG
jgi:putative Holliday junction resolvase